MGDFMRRKKKVLLLGNTCSGKNDIFDEMICVSNKRCKRESFKGEYYYKFENYELINLPDTYNLIWQQGDDCYVRDYLCFEDYDCAVCVIDIADFVNGISLALQIMEITDKMVVLINGSPAENNIDINTGALTKHLGVPVVKATALSGKGINELLEQIYLVANRIIVNEPKTVFYNNDIEYALYRTAKGMKGNIETEKSHRFLALMLLKNDSDFNYSFKEHFGRDIFHNGSLRGNLNTAKLMLENKGIGREKYEKAIALSILEKSKSIYDACITKNITVKKHRKYTFLRALKYSLASIAALAFVAFLIICIYNHSVL